MSYFEKQYIVCNLIESAEAHIEADNGIVFRSDSSDSVKKMAKDLNAYLTKEDIQIVNMYMI